eukprot:8223927-Pyramimonas_sp.AAC.1
MCVVQKNQQVLSLYPFTQFSSSGSLVGEETAHVFCKRVKRTSTNVDLLPFVHSRSPPSKPVHVER